jgi:SAM-dependent methyltransferase
MPAVVAEPKGDLGILPPEDLPAFDRDRGSFRDPHGTVVHAGGRILRVVDPAASRDFRSASGRSLIDALVQDGLLVESRILDGEDAMSGLLRSKFPHAGDIYEHRRIGLPTYPSEWSFAMIADAGILTLDIQLRLAARGFALQDASAYNVFFDGGKPVFIDLTSIRPAPRSDIWYGLGQFQRMFLYPLLLKRYRGIDTKGYYLAHLDGLDARAVGKILGAARLRPACLLDVALPALFGRGRPAPEGGMGSRRTDRPGNPEVQCFHLRRLRGKLERLRARYRPASAWSGYEEKNSYDEESKRLKSRFVEDFLRAHRPRTVTDLGCNAGHFSRIAAAQGAKVTAIDSDHDCIDALYRSLAVGDGRAAIQPVWMGFENPTPAMGLDNAERPAFLSRHRAEAVLALALAHHLRVSCRIPFDLQADLFSRLAGEWLIIEYVDPRDVMFRTLCAYREDLYREVTEGSFIRSFEPRFAVVDLLRLPGGTRTLFALRKK